MRKRLATIAVVILISTASAVYGQDNTSKPSSTKTHNPPRAQTTKPAGTAVGASASGAAKAATPAPEPRISVKGWKTYCSEEGAYCISYPPTWNVVGDVFEGTGVVMAPPQEGKDKSQWDEVTASVAYLPETEDKDPPTFDEILSVALKDLPGKNVQTLQRTEMVLAKRPAQLVKVQYEDQDTAKPWIEEIVFIDDGDAIYSTALRTTPEDLEKLEPVFKAIVATWRGSEEAPAVPAPPASPKKPVMKPPSTKEPPSR